jgi:hypothetical protein
MPSGRDGRGRIPTASPPSPPRRSSESRKRGGLTVTRGAQGGPESPEQPAPLYDSALILIPPHLRPVFEAAPLFDKALEHFRQITTLANAIGEGPAAAHFKVGVSFERDLDGTPATW